MAGYSGTPLIAKLGYRAGQRALLESIALRRLGTPEDIARAVVFFASDEAGWITGQTISVDGGHWMLG